MAPSKGGKTAVILQHSSQISVGTLKCTSNFKVNSFARKTPYFKKCFQEGAGEADSAYCSCKGPKLSSQHP